MGVLDDAIRQHLELKRAHGADESEVQRKESEALGPVRRETAPAPQEEEAVEVSADPPLEHSEAELAPEQPLEPVDEADHEESPFDEPFAPDPPRGETPTRGFDAVADDDPLSEPPPPGPATSADEDVLEETPDFLQETPEHDRLWFEQKPPRDFDFDE